MSHVASLQQALNERRVALELAGKMSRWRTAMGKFSPEEAAASAGRWPEVSLPHSWAPSDGAAGFWHKLSIPAEVEGISLAGSSLTLEVFVVLGAQVFINGEQRYEAEFWSDSQVVPIEVSKSLSKASSYDVFIQTTGGDGFGYFVSCDARVSAIEEWMFKLSTFAEELGFCQFLLDSGDVADDGTLAKAAGEFDLGALKMRNWDAVDASMESVRRLLAPVFRPAAKAYRVHLAGHAHIDMNWLWPWRETVELIRRDFESVDAIMSDYPDVCFSHSQAATYRAMQEHHPRLFERVRERIAQGRWDVTASTWVEGDLNMSGYETLIRQFVEGMRYCREELGVSPQVCWEPDTFGHVATLPQILRRAGVRFYYHTRCGKGEPVNWWEAPDGSRVLVFNDPMGYNGRIWAHTVLPVSKILATRYGLKTAMFVYGMGDHGGGPTRADVQRAIRLRESPLLPEFRFSKTVDFFREVESSGLDFPVIRGELNTAFEGCYTSHGDIKWANRRGENELVAAETLAAIAGMSVGDELREAWRTQCFNQFHDILCGCAIGVTYHEAVPNSDEGRREAAAVASRALDAIVSHQDDAVTVVNTLSWTRSDVVVIEGVDWSESDVLVDAAGVRCPVQRLGESLVFVARDVPPLAARTYRRETVPDAAAERPRSLTICTGRFAAAIDPRSGTITALTDTMSGRNLAYPPASGDTRGSSAGGSANLLEVAYEAPHSMSAWVIGAITRIDRLLSAASVTPGAFGPVVEEVIVEHVYGDSTIRQSIRAWRDLDRIDLVFDIDWAGTGSGTTDAPMLRLRNSVALGEARAAFDIPFAALSRPRDGREVPALHWVDLSEDGGYGLAVLNDGKYGHSVDGNKIVTTLVRSSYEPDNRPDVGHHAFTVSLLPHQGSWAQAGVQRRGLELNSPLAVRKGAAAGEASLIVAEQLGSPGWEPAPGVMLTAVRRHGDALIVRVAEMHGRQVRVRLIPSFDVDLAEETDLHETAVRTLGRAGVVDLGVLRPHQIRTIRIRAAR